MSWLHVYRWLPRLTLSRRGISISVRVPGTRLRLVWQRTRRRPQAKRPRSRQQPGPIRRVR